MARLMYGGTPADFAIALGDTVVIPGTVPEANGRVALIPEASVTFQVYDAAGGSPVTDLQLPGGPPITEVQSSAEPESLGTIPVFFGPDGYTADLWLSADTTTFYRMAPSTADLHDRVADLEDLSLDDLSDVDLTGAADGEVLTRAGGQWVPGAAGAGTVTSVNGVAPVGGNVTLAPSSLSPPAATAVGLAAVSAIVGARLLQAGAGYPARPAAAQWVHFIGTVTPTTGVQDGDVWDQPVVS